MRRSIFIAALAVATCLAMSPPAAAQVGPLPADIQCAGGRPVAITALVPIAGVLTLYLPPDVCEEPAAKEPPRQASPAPRRGASAPTKGRPTST